MKLTRPLVCIDLETTGTEPTKDRIVEFAAVVMAPDGGLFEFSQRFNPGMPIPPAAISAHKITDEMVRDCPHFVDWAPRIHKGMQGKDIAGYNLRTLDLPILDEEFRRAGLSLDLDGVQIIDAFGIYRKKEPRKLSDAVRLYCRREHQEAHGALPDALATLDVLKGQISKYPDLAPMELHELAKFSQVAEVDYVDFAGKLYRDADGDLCFSFGKCKDQKVRRARGFAEWMLSKDFTGNTKDCVEAELERTK